MLYCLLDEVMHCILCETVHLTLFRLFKWEMQGNKALNWDVPSGNFAWSKVLHLRKERSLNLPNSCGEGLASTLTHLPLHSSTIVEPSSVPFGVQGIVPNNLENPDGQCSVEYIRAYLDKALRKASMNLEISGAQSRLWNQPCEWIDTVAMTIGSEDSIVAMFELRLFQHGWLFIPFEIFLPSVSSPTFGTLPSRAPGQSKVLEWRFSRFPVDFRTIKCCGRNVHQFCLVNILLSLIFSDFCSRSASACIPIVLLAQTRF